MLDLLDEVPDEQRRDAVVSRTEQGRLVVEHQLEHRCESRLQISGVREPVVQRGRLGQQIEFTDHGVERVLQSGVAPDQSLHMLAVRGRVMAFLTHERHGFLGHLRIADPRLGLHDHLHDHLLETDGQERDRVGHARPGRILRVPQEGNVLILESEVHFSGLKVGHLSNLVFRRGWSGGRSGTESHVWQ